VQSEACRGPDHPAILNQKDLPFPILIGEAVTFYVKNQRALTIKIVNQCHQHMLLFLFSKRGPLIRQWRQPRREVDVD
jgi:hypothetical protein